MATAEQQSQGQGNKPEFEVNLGLFGGVIGLITALSTTANISVTVIGLFFTLIGGSFLAWYKPDVGGSENRADLIRNIGRLAAGCLVGLIAGLGLQFVREYWVMPAIVRKYQEMGIDLPPDAIAQDIRKNRPFRIQASEQDYLQLSKDLDNEMKTNKNLTDKDKAVLKVLNDALPFFLEAAKELREDNTRSRLDPQALKSLNTVISPISAKDKGN